jgi:hypothetical protein
MESMLRGHLRARFDFFERRAFGFWRMAPIHLASKRSYFYSNIRIVCMDWGMV